MRFCSKSGVGVDRITFNEGALYRVDLLLTGVFPNLVQNSYNGAVQIAAHHVDTILGQRKASLFMDTGELLMRFNKRFVAG